MSLKHGACSAAVVAVVLGMFGPWAAKAPAATAKGSRMVAIASAPGSGFLVASATGRIHSHARAFHGSPQVKRIRLGSPVVGLAAAAGGGYLETTSGGNVYSFGTPFHGSPRVRGIGLGSKVVGISSAPRSGYLIATAGGKVLAFGMKFQGSPRADRTRLRSPVVGIAALPGGGYIEVTAGGVVYRFGPGLRGSPRANRIRLRSPVVGIAALVGGGYAVATAGGNVYTYAAQFDGSPHADGVHLQSKVAGIAAAAGGGYLEVTRAGRVFSYRARPSRLGATAGCASPSGVSATPTPRLGGEGSLVTVGAKYVLQLLGEGAAVFAEDEGLGWVLNLLGGQQGPSVDPAHIDQEFSDVNSKLDALQAQQYADCQAIQASLLALKNQADYNSYAQLSSQMDTWTTKVISYQNDYNDIVTALIQNGGNVDQLDGTYKQDLVNMLSGDVDNGLSAIIDQINEHEVSNAPSAPGMVLAYSTVLDDEAGYSASNSPFTNHVFPSAFVDAAYAQQNYYAAFVAQAAFLYANAAHLSFTLNGNSYKANPQGITELVNRAQDDIQGWSTAFSDNQIGGGGWVGQGNGQGIGPLPENTVLDYRLQNEPLLWTDGPAALNGAPAPDGPWALNGAPTQASTPAPDYCASTAQFCYANNFDTSGRVGLTELAGPSASALPALIAAQSNDPTAAGWQSLTGWRVPTSSDWKALQSGATGGLSAWGTGLSMHVFNSQKTTLYPGGAGTTVATIAPVLVNTGTAANPSYGVLSSANPSANTLTLQGSPFPGPDPDNDTAGRLFLVQNFSPTTAPAPLTAPHPPDFTGIAHRSPKDRVSGKKPVHRRHPRRPVLRAPAPMPSPTTYSTPTSCAQPDVYTVPAGAGSVKITAVGAAGGDGTEGGGSYLGSGGLGGTVTQTVPAAAGTKLFVQVGGAGSTGTGATGDPFVEPGGQGGVGGGGAGGQTIQPASKYEGDFNSAHSGGGGGASAVSTTQNCSQWVVVAGGGGGGGSGYTDWGYAETDSYTGGHAGNACPIGTSGCLTAGGGEGTNAGGPGGTPPNNFGGNGGGVAGSAMQGGAGGSQNPGGGGGGGGGGYYGGGQGGGGGGATAGGGGGGGASFAIPGAGAGSYGLGQTGQSGSVTITPIVKPPAPISLAASSTQVSWGQPLTLTATVPTDAAGLVGFYEDVNHGCDGTTGPGAACQPLGTATIMNGIATQVTQTPQSPVLGIGAHVILASFLGNTGGQSGFAGDRRYLPNNSAPVTVTVAQATPGPVLTILGTNPASGTAPKSMTVKMPTDATGTVEFSDLTHLAGPDVGLGTAPVVNGYATLTTFTRSLPDGTNQIRASYSGDGHYLPDNSNIVTVTVGAPSAGRVTSP